MSDDIASFRLCMTGVRKQFGATRALSDVDLRVGPGEVHALIGENGAGKSTLMKVLSGAVAPDSGSMHIDGVPFAPRRPEDARACGVAMIYQELTLAPHLTVEENVTLGLEETFCGFLRRRTMRRRVVAALEQLGHSDIRPGVRVRDLSIGAQQLVEVARALVSQARIVVMDEPTSSLTREDTVTLFELIRRLRDRGVSIIYISHFLEEVREIADRFTVLRDGVVTGTGSVADTPTERIIELMVGRRLSEMFPRVPREPGEPVLELHGLCGPGMPRNVNLSLRRGEILGLFGLIGAGRSELVRTVFGLRPTMAGTITIAPPGRPAIIDSGATPVRRLAQGVGMLSESRKDEGLALPMSVADNITLSRLGTVSRAGVLNLRRQREAARQWIDRLEIRTQGPAQAVWNLSGGNQQKVAIARLLHQSADILLLDEPTRGIDVGAKIQIYRLMGELAAAGKAILFVSSYLPELMGVCDRIGVMSRGRLADLRDVSRWTEREIMTTAVGGDA
ncbi:MAG TPA: sugar ABC transporter ATP-binding protein [Phycisphaerae bacterium]|nr:sugar ABC transporter ATP-binding protein [Phycisphaerae bacterium]HOJ73059.1 sugar ABC transporter ATP-binding protein [Phycisphaerae bacterium]HOM52675.1 sugar ABC transporter ATP-binding protein [Phycisphaerae bacterium]HOQ85070.1 sugar ABC transporter ATP-binding protein [Phycisphaerae bacterium]HPP25503.1 sugar ABC transporter ATP-binding protein [Phycisphaerae bacterium]